MPLFQEKLSILPNCLKKLSLGLYNRMIFQERFVGVEDGDRSEVLIKILKVKM